MIRRRVNARAQDGIAVVVGLEVLAVATLLVVVVVAAGVSLRDASTRDTNSKRALEAAQAGVDVARYRINKIAPATASATSVTGKCITDTAVSPGTGGAAAGQCPGYGPVDLGNGASYKYWVTPVIGSPYWVAPAGFKCGGVTPTVVNSTQVQRCITSAGTVNGVTRRVQTLIKGDLGTPFFQLNGILALNSINVNETSSANANLRGSIGSNGSVTVSGSCNATLFTWDPAPGATLTEGCTGSPQAASPARTAPYTLTGLDSLYAGSEATNDNATVFGASNGRWSASNEFTYTAAGRTLKDNTNGTLTINGVNPRANSNGAWIFNLCSLNFTHVTSIRLTGGAVAAFYMDSSERAGSGCSGTGSLIMTGVSYMNYNTTVVPPTPDDPAALQFWFYGSGTIHISNQSGFSAAIYAPNTTVQFTNKTAWLGGIAAKALSATNGLDFTPGDVSGAGRPGPFRYVRTQPGWVECVPAATVSTDPQSGC